MRWWIFFAKREFDIFLWMKYTLRWSWIIYCRQIGFSIRNPFESWCSFYWLSLNISICFLIKKNTCPHSLMFHCWEKVNKSSAYWKWTEEKEFFVTKEWKDEWHLSKIFRIVDEDLLNEYFPMIFIWKIIQSIHLFKKEVQ